jgi:hypothetical protein
MIYDYKKELKTYFPKLEYWNTTQTSNIDSSYNCIAWALENNENWIWPDKDNDIVMWPSIIPRILNKAVFIKLFGLYGYKIISNKDISLEPNVKKIAIYVDSFNKPSHAARQLPNGKWTSKLGIGIDIEHDSLEVLEGQLYGKADIIMGKMIKAY